MKKLQKFKPLLAACSQGQKRSGVDEGAIFTYKHCVSHFADEEAMIVEHDNFNSQFGHMQLYN